MITNPTCLNACKLDKLYDGRVQAAGESYSKYEAAQIAFDKFARTLGYEGTELAEWEFLYAYRDAAIAAEEEAGRVVWSNLSRYESCAHYQGLTLHAWMVEIGGKWAWEVSIGGKVVKRAGNSLAKTGRLARAAAEAAAREYLKGKP